jgi:hypothetical protein
MGDLDVLEGKSKNIIDTGSSRRVVVWIKDAVGIM